MKTKIVVFSLLLLVFIAFFSGLNLGKYVQKIDTPTKIKTVITKIVVTKSLPKTKLSPRLSPLLTPEATSAATIMIEPTE